MLYISCSPRRADANTPLLQSQNTRLDRFPHELALLSHVSKLASTGVLELYLKPSNNGALLLVVVVVAGRQPQVRPVRRARGSRPVGVPGRVLLAAVQAHGVRAAGGHAAHRRRRRRRQGGAQAEGRRGSAGVRARRRRRRRGGGRVRGVPRGDEGRGEGPPAARVRPPVPRRVHRPVVQGQLHVPGLPRRRRRPEDGRGGGGQAWRAGAAGDGCGAKLSESRRVVWHGKIHVLVEMFASYAHTFSLVT